MKRTLLKIVIFCLILFLPAVSFAELDNGTLNGITINSIPLYEDLVNRPDSCAKWTMCFVGVYGQLYDQWIDSDFESYVGYDSESNQVLIFFKIEDKNYLKFVLDNYFCMYCDSGLESSQAIEDYFQSSNICYYKNDFENMFKSACFTLKTIAENN